MSNTPTNEREFRLDALERLNNLLNMLEERICVLLGKNDPESMKPAEREQAASRYLMLMPRLLQLRQQYSQASSREEAHAEYEEILQALREAARATDNNSQFTGVDDPYEEPERKAGKATDNNSQPW